MVLSNAKADAAIWHASHRLRIACLLLNRPLLPNNNTTIVVEQEGTPSLRPRVRQASVPGSPGSRASHVCTHRQGDQVDEAVGDERQSGARDAGTSDSTTRKQPNPGVIRQDLNSLEAKFDAFTIALANFCSVMDQQEEVERYEQHLVLWTDYIGWLTDRANDVLLLSLIHI